VTESVICLNADATSWLLFLFPRGHRFPFFFRWRDFLLEGPPRRVVVAPRHFFFPSFFPLDRVLIASPTFLSTSSFWSFKPPRGSCLVFLPFPFFRRRCGCFDVGCWSTLSFPKTPADLLFFCIPLFFFSRVSFCRPLFLFFSLWGSRSPPSPPRGRLFFLAKPSPFLNGGVFGGWLRDVFL